MDDPQRHDRSIPGTGVRHPAVDCRKTHLQGDQGMLDTKHSPLRPLSGADTVCLPLLIQSKFGYQCVPVIWPLALCARAACRRLRLTPVGIPSSSFSASSWSRTASRQRLVRNTVSYASHVSPESQLRCSTLEPRARFPAVSLHVHLIRVRSPRAPAAPPAGQLSDVSAVRLYKC